MVEIANLGALLHDVRNNLVRRQEPRVQFLLFSIVRSDGGYKCSWGYAVLVEKIFLRRSASHTNVALAYGMRRLANCFHVNLEVARALIGEAKSLGLVH